MRVRKWQTPDGWRIERDRWKLRAYSPDWQADRDEAPTWEINFRPNKNVPRGRPRRPLHLDDKQWASLSDEERLRASIHEGFLYAALVGMARTYIDEGLSERDACLKALDWADWLPKKDRHEGQADRIRKMLRDLKST